MTKEQQRLTQEQKEKVFGKINRLIQTVKCKEKQRPEF